MAAALYLLRLSRCGSVSQNCLRWDYPQLNIMKIFQSDLEFYLTRADYRFLKTYDHSLGRDSCCYFRSTCSISAASLPLEFSSTQRNTVWLLSGDMTLPDVTFPYHY